MITLSRRVHPIVWVASTCTIGLLFLLGVLSYQAIDREYPQIALPPCRFSKSE